MTHSEVLMLKDGDRVIATQAGGAADRPRYTRGTTGKVVRFELTCPAVIYRRRWAAPRLRTLDEMGADRRAPAKD